MARRRPRQHRSRQRRPRQRPTDEILVVRPQRSFIPRLSSEAMMREEQDAKVVRQRLKKLVMRQDSTTHEIVWQDYATKHGRQNRASEYNRSDAANSKIFQPRWDLPPRPPPIRLTAEEEEAAAVYLSVEEYLDLRPDDSDIDALLRQSANGRKAAQESMKVLRHRIKEATEDCLTNLTSVLGPRGQRALKRLLTQRPGSALLLDCLSRVERKDWLADTGFDRLDSDGGPASGASLARDLREQQVAEDPPGTLKDKLDVLNTPPGMFHGICAAIWMCRYNHVRHTGPDTVVWAGEIFTTRPAEALRFIQMTKGEQKDWLLAHDCVFGQVYNEDYEEEEESVVENEEMVEEEEDENYDDDHGDESEDVGEEEEEEGVCAHHAAAMTAMQVGQGTAHLAEHIGKETAFTHREAESHALLEAQIRHAFRMQRQHPAEEAAEAEIMEEEGDEGDEEDEEEGDERGEQTEDHLTSISRRKGPSSDRPMPGDPSGDEKIFLVTPEGEFHTDKKHLLADIHYSLAEDDRSPSERAELERLLQVVQALPPQRHNDAPGEKVDLGVERVPAPEKVLKWRQDVSHPSIEAAETRSVSVSVFVSVTAGGSTIASTQRRVLAPGSANVRKRPAHAEITIDGRTFERQMV